MYFKPPSLCVSMNVKVFARGEFYDLQKIVVFSGTYISKVFNEKRLKDHTDFFANRFST